VTGEDTDRLDPLFESRRSSILHLHRAIILVLIYFILVFVGGFIWHDNSI
jgi:hypothetical protein